MADPIGSIASDPKPAETPPVSDDHGGSLGPDVNEAAALMSPSENDAIVANKVEETVAAASGTDTVAAGGTDTTVAASGVDTVPAVEGGTIPNDVFKELLKATQGISEALKPKPEPVQPKDPWKPYRVQAKDIDNILESNEKAAEFFNNVIDNILVNMAQIVVPFVQQQVQPIQQHTAAQVHESARNEFRTKYSDLAEFIPEAEEIANKIYASNPDFYNKNSREKFYDDVAGATRKLIARYRAVQSGAASIAPPPAAPSVKARGGNGKTAGGSRLTPEQEEMRAVAEFSG